MILFSNLTVIFKKLLIFSSNFYYILVADRKTVNPGMTLVCVSVGKAAMRYSLDALAFHFTCSIGILVTRWQ